LNTSTLLYIIPIDKLLFKLGSLRLVLLDCHRFGSVLGREMIMHDLASGPLDGRARATV